MNVFIKVGDILTVKDLITHLKVIQGQILNSKVDGVEGLSKIDLSDSNCYGWHEVKIGEGLEVE